MIRRLLALFSAPSDLRVSKAWLRRLEGDSRVEFHGVAIRFPIQKLKNERPRRLVGLPRRRSA